MEKLASKNHIKNLAQYDMIKNCVQAQGIQVQR